MYYKLGEISAIFMWKKLLVLLYLLTVDTSKSKINCMRQLGLTE